MADLGLTIETAQPSRPTGKNVAEGQSISVRRDAFLFEDSPGNALDKKKLTGKDNLTKSEYSEISNVVIDRIRTQLNQYMDNLANVYEKNPRLLDIPGHEHERQAWQLLGNSDHDVRGAKIADFLGSTSGLKFADGLLQDLGSRKLQVVGLYATTNEPGERDDVVDPGVYRQGKDKGQGAANRAWHGTIRPKLHEIGPEEHLGKFRAVVGTLAGSAMAGADIGGRTDGLRGFVIGGGVGFAAGVAGLVGGNETGKLFRTGKTLETKRSVDALAALQTNADEVEYFKIMYNIDLTKFDVDVANQTVEPNGDKQYVSRLRDEGLQALEVHRALYKDLGVPEDRLDTMPELNLFESATLGGFEQSSSRTGQEIIDAYYEGGYDPATHTLADNQDRMTKARSQVMTKLASEYIRNEQDVKNRSKDRPVATMRAKLGEYGGDDPAVMARRLKKENERKDKLTTEKTAREAELSQFKESDDDRETLQKTAEELRQPPYSLPIPANPTSVDVNTIVNGQLTTLNDSLRNRATRPTGLRVDLQTAQRNYNAELAAERRRLTTDARAGMGTKDTLSEETKRNIEKEAADHATFLHGADIERLTQEIAEVEKTIVDLKKLEETYRDTSKGLTEKQRELLVNAPKELVATHRSYDTLRRTAGATITDVLLESQTVDQLITMATVPPYSLPNGTPAEQAALRKMIIQAKSELKGRREEIVNPSPRDQKRAITEIALRTGLPITVDDLLNTKSDAELIHLLSTNAAYAGLRAGIAARGSDIRSELALAKAEAAKRLRNRYRAELEEGIKDDEKQIEAIDTKAKDLTPTLNAEKVQIQTSLDMIDRQESLYIAAEKITHDVDMRDKITNLSTYKAADKAILSQSEQDLVDKKRVPRGYFELMDLFFDYRTRSDRNRSDYFNQISTVLPPDKLARLLNQSLGLGVRNSLPAVLTAMNTRIEAGTLDRKHLRIGFNAITDRLQEEALALS